MKRTGQQGGEVHKQAGGGEGNTQGVLPHHPRVLLSVPHRFAPRQAPLSERGRRGESGGARPGDGAGARGEGEFSINCPVRLSRRVKAPGTAPTRPGFPGEWETRLLRHGKKRNDKKRFTRSFPFVSFASDAPYHVLLFSLSPRQLHSAICRFPFFFPRRLFPPSSPSP